MKKIPPYCPIKSNFYFDKDRLIQEIDLLISNKAQERTLPFENGKSVYDQQGLLKIADDSDLNDTTRYFLDENGKRVPIEGKYKTYHVFNLTYLPEEPESMIDIYRTDDPEKNIFSHVNRRKFVWREELENTYIKEVVEQFPWEYLQTVRLIYMKPPSIGQIHVDSHPVKNLKYFRDGHASITLNIEPGGGILNYLESGEQKQVSNDQRIFHFDDSVPHGVTPITSERYQLRMWGKLAVPYQELLEST